MEHVGYVGREPAKRYGDDNLTAIAYMHDVAKDGPFIMSQRDLTLRFRGSRNQRLLPADEIQKIVSAT